MEEKTNELLIHLDSNRQKYKQIYQSVHLFIEGGELQANTIQLTGMSWAVHFTPAQAFLGEYELVKKAKHME